MPESMAAATVKRPDYAVRLARITHGVHVECQEDREHYIAVCGWQCDPRNRSTPRPEDRDLCIVCYTLIRCPVCGSALRA